jgi:hypothetical protein
MFEDEEGCIFKALQRGESSRIFLEKDKDIETLRSENKALEARLAKIEAHLNIGQ